MFSKLTDCMDKDVTVVQVQGCATLIGYRESIAKSLKVVQVAGLGPCEPFRWFQLLYY